jgi:hypothetical protein
LHLILQPREAKKVVAKLKRSKIEEFAAKDIVRAANARLLPMTDSDVKKDRQLIDGYHRLCAVYSLDEQAMIPAK